MSKTACFQSRFGNGGKKKHPSAMRSGAWRRVWDSNPRYREVHLISSEFAFLRSAAGSWDYGRADVSSERPPSGTPAGAKARKTLIFQWVPGFFFIQTTFRFFRAETAKLTLPRGPVFQLFSARKPTYTHFAGKTTQKIRECTEVLWWGCVLLRRADGKEQRWQSRRKPSTPSTSAT